MNKSNACEFSVVIVTLLMIFTAAYEQVYVLGVSILIAL